MNNFFKALPLIFLIGFSFGCSDADPNIPNSGDVENPGHNDDTPGHNDDTPGHNDDTPGHNDNNPGHNDDTPGHNDNNPGSDDTVEPDINIPGENDRDKLHITNNFEIKYFLDKDYLHEIDVSKLTYIVPEKSIYVKCIVDTTNYSDKDYLFRYFIEIDNMTGFSLKDTKGGESPVTVHPPRKNLDESVTITVDDIAFLQAPATSKTTEFTFLISKEGNKNGNGSDKSSNITSSTIKVYRKISDQKAEYLNKFDSELHFNQDNIKSIVPTPTFNAKNNCIEVTLSDLMSEVSLSDVDVYYGYDGDINNNSRCDQKKDDPNTYIINNIDNHNSVKLTIRTSNPTEIDYKKEFSLSRLNAPKLNYDNMKLSWNSVDNATTYGLEYSMNNGDFIYLDAPFSELECPLKSIIKDSGTYSFRIESYTKQDINNDFKGIVYFQSLKSDVVSVRKLAAPIITRQPGSRKLEWEHILYADMYEIYVNGEKTITTEDNFFEIGSDFDGKRIEIKSVSKDKNIIPSDFSEKYMVNQA